MIGGQLFERIARHPEDAGVATVKQVRRIGLENQRAEGADIPFVFVETIGAVARLRIKPGIGGFKTRCAEVLTDQASEVQ